MADIRVIAKLKAMGDFPIADVEDIDFGGIRLDVVINQVRQTLTDVFTAIEENENNIRANSGKIEANTTAINDLRVDLSTAETAIASKASQEEVNTIKTDLVGKASAETVTQLQTEMNVQKTRMDQLVGTVPEGSADEIADARVTADGRTEANLGNAIRSQVTSLKETIVQNYEATKYASIKRVKGHNKLYLNDSADMELISLNASADNNDYIVFCSDNILDTSSETLKKGYYIDKFGEEIRSDYFSTTDYIPVMPNTEYYYASKSDILPYLEFCGLQYDAQNNVIGSIPSAYMISNIKFTTLPNCRYVRLMFLNRNIKDNPYFCFNTTNKKNIENRSTGFSYCKISEIYDKNELKTYSPHTTIFTYGNSDIDLSYVSNATNAFIYRTPQEYGALSDGVHDCTEALTEVISNHNCVYIPKGRYVISNTLYFEGVSNVSIMSDGAEIYLADNTNNKPMFSLVDCRNIVINGVHFHGNRENQTLVKSGSKAIDFSENCACIIVEKSIDISITNCEFYDCQGDGIQIDQLYYPDADYTNSHSKNVKIYNNTFDKIGRNGIAVVHAKNTEIYNNTFRNISWYSSTIATGVDVESGTGAATTIDNTVIRNNHFRDCLFGVLVCGTETANTYVYGNVITNTAKGEYGFMTSNLPRPVYVANNNIERCVYNVYTIGKCYGLQFVNNTLSKAKQNVGDIENGGFNMYFNGDTQNVSIVGNTLDESESNDSIKFAKPVTKSHIINNVLLGSKGIAFATTHDCTLYNIINGVIVTDNANSITD